MINKAKKIYQQLLISKHYRGFMGWWKKCQIK